jgi:endoglucanase
MELTKIVLSNTVATVSGDTITISPVLLPVPASSPVVVAPSPVSPVPVTASINTALSGYGKALELSLYGMTWQVSGKKPAWSKNPYQNDCFLNDGQDVGKDLSGGFHDAGDYIKVALASATGACQVALSLLFYRQAYATTGQTDMALSILKQYCDWFLKCQEIDSTGTTTKYYHWVSDSGTDHADMRPSSKQDGAKRKSFAIGGNGDPFGDEPLANVAASFALCSQVFRSVGQTDYAGLLEMRAYSLYEFAKSRKGKYQARTVYASSSRGDELVLAATCMYGMSKKAIYLAEAESFAKEFNVYPGYAYMADNQGIPAIVLLAYYTQKEQWISVVRNLTSSWLNGTSGVRKHPNNPLRSSSDWGTIPQVGAVWLCLKIASDFIPALKNDAIASEGKKILDYCLGSNAKGFSFLVGYGQNYPKNIHHRSTIGQAPGGGNLDGTGLWVAGEKLDGFYQDIVTDWITNEAGCYNTAMIGFITSLI